MLRNLKKRTEGFTIIEVMIVLAIAGLIMLIVFLAIPALQRNSRNTQRKNDVGKVIAAINEYTNNNNGQLPTSGNFSTTALPNAKLGIYNTRVTAPGGSPAWPANVDDAYVFFAYRCDATNPNSSAPTSQNRSTIVLYKVETGGGTPTDQCLDG